MAHRVFLLYGTQKTLLYVGYSAAHITRMLDSLRNVDWQDEVTTVKILTYPTEVDARYHEMKMFKEGVPKYTITLLCPDCGAPRMRNATYCSPCTIKRARSYRAKRRAASLSAAAAAVAAVDDPDYWGPS